jgi:3'-5' exoribonuclease
MKEFFVADAPRFENQTVTTYFCLASISLRDRKGGGGQYLALSLADKTGQLEARMWEEFAAVVETCAEGCYVKVQGQISKYNGRFQITLTRMRAASSTEIESADFVPTTQFEIPAMMAELRGYVEAFTSAHLRNLVLRFFDDPAIGAAFQEAPAAKRLHHAWLGGLLEHVLALVRVCRATAPFYPEVDPDLLVTGAILHDIGKVRELSWRTNFNYTLEGQLIGHITIAQRMLSEAISAMDAEARETALRTGGEPELFPEPLRVLVEHMILAHHGKLEFGSPKLPMTPEAMLLSALDDLEAKFQTIRTEFAAAREAGRRPDETTEWVRSMDRNLFDSRRFLETRQDAAAGGETAAEGSDAASEDPGATEAAAVAEEDPAATDEAGGAAEAVLLSDLFPDA